MSKVVLVIKVKDENLDALLDHLGTAIDNKAVCAMQVGKIARAPFVPMMVRVQ